MDLAILIKKYLEYKEENGLHFALHIDKSPFNKWDLNLDNHDPPSNLTYVY
jgi:hypothetical protein